jgi:predicted DNA-binding transcriptional regulator YafY
VGRKGSTETISAVLLAFLEQPVWRQAELAERLAIQRKSLKRILDDLTHAGLPLEREEDHPNVYWSVPKSWFPGAVAFRGDDVVKLLRVLRHAPEGPTRAHLLEHLVKGATGLREVAASRSIVTASLGSEDELRLWQIEESVEKRCPLHVRYLTASRGDDGWRHVSVHRIVMESPPRLVAMCHREDRLKWFRLDNVLWARPDSSVDFKDMDAGAVDDFVRQSVHGFHSGDTVVCVFHVRKPEARWVRAQLDFPHTQDESAESVTFTTRTAGMLPLARFVVGLGEAAQAVSPELKALVEELARGALAGAQ